MKLANTLAVLLALNVVAAPSAKSQDVKSFIQNFAGKYVISWSDLESKLADLDAQISQASTNGRLSGSQTSDFRNELKKIQLAAATAKAAGGRLSIPQSMDFSNQLNALNSELQDAVNNTVSSLPDVDALNAELHKQIDTALAQGHLNAQTAASLRTQLQQQEAIEAAYKAETQSALTARQIELLAASLNKIKVDIDQQIKIGQSAIPALTERKAAIETKIQSAVTNATLSTIDADYLRKQLTDISNEQTTLLAAGAGTLNGSQVLRLARSLDKVDDAVSARISSSADLPYARVPSTRVPSAGFPSDEFPARGSQEGVSIAQIDTLRDRIAARINTMARRGKLSALDAAKHTHSLDQIVAEQQNFVRLGMTRQMAEKLMNDLDSLNSLMDSQIQVAITQPDSDASINPGSDADRGNKFDVSNLPVLGAKNFADVTGYWGQQYVEELAARGVIGGFPDGTFHPNAEITRAQFAAIVGNALHLPAESNHSFQDVRPGYWASGAIATASAAGLITGFPDGTFRPEDKITRAQALVILSKTLRRAAPRSAAIEAYTDADSVPGWAKRNVTAAARAHIIVNFPNANQIRPNELATRGEVAALMYQTLTALGADLPRLTIGVIANNN